MNIVVIIPTYNEKVNIERMIPVLEKEIFPKITNHNMSILVADDKSPDGTREVVERYMKVYNNLHILEGNKQGLGAAYVRAMRYAMNEMKAYAIIEFDADFQHDPHDIPRLVEAMDEGYDYVIGSRYVPGGTIPKEWGFHRKFLSRFGSIFARFVWWNFKVHDTTSGLKLTKSEYLRKVDLEHLFSKYYAYKMHILHDILKMGARVKEVPIIFYERKEGTSKISSKDMFDSFYVVIRLRIDDSKRVFKFLFVGGTGFIVQVLAQEISIRTGFASLLSGAAKIFNSTSDEVVLSHSTGAGIGAEAAIISNFLLNNIWTFRDTHNLEEQSPFIIRLIKFNIASLASIFIQFFAVWIAEKIVGTQFHLFGFIILTRIAVLFPAIIFLVIPLNYFIYNRFIWKTQYLKKRKQYSA